MDRIFIEPWLPPLEPSLARLAMEAADAAGLQSLGAWPEVSQGGIAFQAFPPFLPWHGLQAGRHHLVLLQAREVGGVVRGAHLQGLAPGGPGAEFQGLGARVPGPRSRALPPGWLEALDLGALARPLARHPAFGGQASVHVVHLPEPGRGVARTLGEPAEALVKAVLAKVTGREAWGLGPPAEPFPADSK